MTEQANKAQVELIKAGQTITLGGNTQGWNERANRKCKTGQKTTIRDMTLCITLCSLLRSENLKRSLIRSLIGKETQVISLLDRLKVYCAGFSKRQGLDSYKNNPSQSSLMTPYKCVAVSVSAEALPSACIVLFS